MVILPKYLSQKHEKIHPEKSGFRAFLSRSSKIVEDRVKSSNVPLTGIEPPLPSHNQILNLFGNIKNHYRA